MRCRNCNQELARSGKFCRFCGSPQPAPESTGAKLSASAGSVQVTKTLGSPPRLAVAPPAGPGVPARDLAEASSFTEGTAPEWKYQSLSNLPLPALAPPESEVPSNERKNEDPLMLSVRPEDFSLAPPTNVLIGPFQQAGFGLRFGAGMFDFSLYMLWFLLWWPVAAFLAKQNPAFSYSVQGLGYCVFGILLIANHVLLPARQGQTLGKWLVGIRIIQTSFAPVSVFHILKRHLIGYPLSMIFGLGFLWMLWDRRQQGWHDKLAHTLVVRLDV